MPVTCELTVNPCDPTSKISSDVFLAMSRLIFAAAPGWEEVGSELQHVKTDITVRLKKRPHQSVQICTDVNPDALLILAKRASIRKPDTCLGRGKVGKLPDDGRPALLHQLPLAMHAHALACT